VPAPSRARRPLNSWISRLLPRPASPTTETACPWLCLTRVQQERSCWNSESRPTKRVRPRCAWTSNRLQTGRCPTSSWVGAGVSRPLNRIEPTGRHSKAAGDAVGGFPNPDRPGRGHLLEPRREIRGVAPGSVVHAKVVADPAHDDRPRVD